ncbi:MAG: DsbA family protein [Solirubrobacterales bacterium]
MGDRWTSQAVPAPGPADHAAGEGLPLVLYTDLACPACAVTWAQLRDLAGLQLVFRHFPMASKRPRSPALHAAAEAAGRQGALWEMADSIYADQGHRDDPHLWARAEALDLDVDRFEADRRSAAVAERIDRDFMTGVRAGITGTPSAFIAGELADGDPVDAARRAVARGSDR